MKNLFSQTFCLILVVLVTNIFSQAKQYTDVYICQINEGKILVDENLFDQNSKFTYDSTMESCNKLAEKYIGINKTSNYFFDKYQKGFANLTNLKVGDEFFVSTADKVFKAKIDGYQLWFSGAMGYLFNPVFKNSAMIKEDTNNYDKNIFICSKYKNISKMKYECVKDSAVIKKITGFLKEYTKNISIELGDETVPVTKVIKGNFLNSDRDEYVVSYQGRIDFENFASGIFIVSDIGKVMKKVVEFGTGTTYSTLTGIVDYDGDGQFELLIESGYYEGSGYSLHKLIKDKYEVIASGFIWGV